MTRDALLEDLRDVWSSLDEVLAALDDAAWATPTAVPAWSVQDNVSHIIGTESMMAGRATPEVDLGDLPHVRNDVGRMNEAWVVALRDLSPAEMLERYREIVEARTAQLDAMSDEDLAADSWTPAGPATLGRFLQIRVFDQWIHEQDIRTAVDRPGHLSGPAVERTLAEVANGIGFVVGKKAGAPDGASVRFELTGPEVATIDVLVDGRAAVVDGLDGEPTVTLTTDTGTFMRLVAGRADGRAARAEGRVVTTGDVELADRLIDTLGYVI